jgi:hypothetical protein
MALIQLSVTSDQLSDMSFQFTDYGKKAPFSLYQFFEAF